MQYRSANREHERGMTNTSDSNVETTSTQFQIGYHSEQIKHTHQGKTADLTYEVLRQRLQTS